LRPLDIGVVGCGTAGPAAALFLARQGHAVTVYERFEQPRAVGAGIILQPTGQDVLARLGLLAPIVAKGARLDGLEVVHPDGSSLLELRYADVDPRLFGLGLHRGVLFEALYGALSSEPGVRLRLGTPCEGLARARAGKYAVVDASGEQHGPHDLVVVADGARSRLRDDTGLVRRVTPDPWGALWFVGRDREGSFDGKLHQVVDGTHTMLGLLPTGQGPSDDEHPDEARLMSLFWSLRADELPALRARGLGAFRDRALHVEPRAEGMLDQIDDIDQLLFSQYYDVVLSPWNTRGVVHLGDAAHAMSPQLGQGANLALWDAMVLSDALAEEPSELVRALDTYSRERRGHLGYYQLVTRALTPFFQSDHEALGVLRDLFMPLAAKLRLGREAMLMGMCGAADGHPWRWVPGVLS
jgi:2-polyprenyl-6-methoxyphenol hydroxylase-like FAD-dependent oxidoreductase